MLDYISPAVASSALLLPSPPDEGKNDQNYFLYISCCFFVYVTLSFLFQFRLQAAPLLSDFYIRMNSTSELILRRDPFGIGNKMAASQ